MKRLLGRKGVAALVTVVLPVKPVEPAQMPAPTQDDYPVFIIQSASLTEHFDGSSTFNLYITTQHRTGLQWVFVYRKTADDLVYRLRQSNQHPDRMIPGKIIHTPAQTLDNSRVALLEDSAGSPFTDYTSEAPRAPLTRT